MADENLANLYIGRIDKVNGRINDRRKVWFKGEILLYGYIEDDHFVVEGLRRFALYGALLNPPEGDRLGVISLAGPLTTTEPVLNQDQKSGVFNNLLLQLHYRELSITGPRETQEAIFPRVEVLNANVTWEPDGAPTQQKLNLIIELPTGKLEHSWQGRIETLTLEPISVPFLSAISGALLIPQQQGCGQPPPNCTGFEETIRCELLLKFINISARDPSTLVVGIQNQINGACEVWRDKASLELIIELDPQTGELIIEPGGDLGEITSIELTDLTNHIVAEVDYVEIYLAEGFDATSNTDTGGGEARHGGVASAYCVLDVDLLEGNGNKYLLAHELGHVLGLSHHDGSHTVIFPPTAGSPFNWWPGSRNSVMQPNINSPVNTRQNCDILDWPPPNLNPVNLTVPLNSIVKTIPGSLGCFRPG